VKHEVALTHVSDTGFTQEGKIYLQHGMELHGWQYTSAGVLLVVMIGLISYALVHERVEDTDKKQEKPAVTSRWTRLAMFARSRWTRVATLLMSVCTLVLLSLTGGCTVYIVKSEYYLCILMYVYVCIKNVFVWLRTPLHCD